MAGRYYQSIKIEWSQLVKHLAESNNMTKKELKKARIWIKSGYAGGKPVIDVDIEVPCCFQDIDRPGATKTETIARIDAYHLEDFIGKRVRGGAFKFVEGGRKYQRIELI